MASVEEDFPRGGTAKKPTESKIVVQRPEVDNLFQVVFKIYISFLFLANEKWEGMLMLGCVKEVRDFEVTVSLPCGLQGFLGIKNISDSYTKLLVEQLDSICSLTHLFCPGMVLRCVVVKLDITKGGSISIQLSVNPKLVNKALTSSSLKAGMVLSGCVESVEDHGCIIDIGINGSKAFLPKKAIKDKHNLKVGQYVTSQVEAIKSDGRVIQLSVNPLTIAQACAESGQGWNLTNLLPGLLVRATIKKVTKHGLVLDFLSSFSGQVDFLHMEPNQTSSYTEGTKVRACVLYVEPSTHLVGLSLRSYLVQARTRVETTPAGGDRIGEVVKDCKMITMHHMSGAMLELPDKTLAFVHVSLGDTSNIKTLFELAAIPEHTCRILDFSPMDQIHFVSLRRSLIEKQFYRYHDLQAGQVVEGTVSDLLNHGMVVHLSDHIKGLVPRTHLSDIILKNPEKKYTEGMKVKCRVLSVDAENKKLYLTRKKALVESSLPLFLCYTDAHPGRVSHGYIVCIKDFGCIVRFYNDVKGLVPLGELSFEPVINPEEVFYVGQVLKTKVLQCDPQKARMMLKLPSPSLTVRLGWLEARVLKKSVNNLEVTILPDEMRAVLPTVHLSDHTSNCPLLWESLQEGDNISNLVCFNKNKQNIVSILSMTEKLPKTLIVRWSLDEGVVAKDFSEIRVGMQLIGWIKNIMSYGVFVEFPYGLVGLAPKAAMTDKFLGDTTTAFKLGQTIIAKVTNLDEEKHRFLVTLKMSEVISPEGDAQTRLINGLQERRAVAEMLALRGAHVLSLHLGCFPVFFVAYCTVTFNTLHVFVLHKHIMYFLLACFSGVNLTSGQKVTAVVLHVDILSTCVHVSLLSKLVAKKKSLTEGSRYTAMVQYVETDFAVISLDDTAQLTVIQTSCHLNEILLGESEKLKPGRTLAVKVIETSCPELQGLPLVSWEPSAQKQQRTTSENQAGSKGHCFGKIVQGKVRTVKPTCIQITLEDGSTGSVHVSEVVDAAEVCLGSFPTSSVKVGSVVTARVIGGREASSHRFLPFSHPKFTYSIPELTLIPRKTAYLQDASHPEKLYKLGQAVRAKVVEVSSKPRRFVLSLTGVHKLEKGSVTLGMVTNIQPQLGLQVKLPFGGVGTVAVTDLADAYKPNPLDGYSKDQLLRSVDVLYIIRGIVRHVLSEQVHKPCCFERPHVTFTAIDKEEEFVDLSLLPADTGKPDILPESLGLPLRLVGEEKKKHDTKKKKRTLSESEWIRSSKIITQDLKNVFAPLLFQQGTPSSEGPSRLQVAAGFSWDVGLSSLKPASAAQEGDSSDREDQDGTCQPQRKSRHELEQEKKAAEKALVQREAELMDPNLCPQDAAAFERLLLASPNSSLLWLQYMAHHLQATQIEQARAVAERALKTISFSLKKVFERALQFCEPMPVYQQLADIYAKSNKTKEAEGLYKTMVKRFRQNKAVWLSYGSFLLQQGQSDAASAVLQRALKSLPSKESVDVITKFAQLEFRYGDAEKGHTMFDKVLTSYPKRTDLWSVFIDLTIKHGTQKEIRALFDRVIYLSVSVKKIKFFFKRYLEYEKKHGTPQSIQAVKDKAMEFVEAKGTEAAN
uniref:Protein RRP5 homolog n=1 Tax=Monopterus albus TaxID=43700 RepID=A0A3Q3IP10_MONAL